MTNPMINPQQPNYSGVTIQISNPAVNLGRNCSIPNTPQGYQAQAYQAQGYQTQGYQDVPQGVYQVPQAQIGAIPQKEIYGYATNPQMTQQPNGFQTYPAQYYLNNYNYQGDGRTAENANGKNGTENAVNKSDIEAINKELENIKNVSEPANKTQNADSKDVNSTQAGEIANEANQTDSVGADGTALKHYDTGENKDTKQDMTKSSGIIDDLDAREEQIKADKKNSKQKRVVALTDEYIKSLENYLNNPNDEIRLMASKEILMRLDEDRDRYNDAALNALLNKMLQDPSKLIRVAALSAFASQLASGNDFTVELLHNIQANPSADKEDVLQAADILLKMAGGTEVKNIPNPAVKEDVPQDGVKGQ